LEASVAQPLLLERALKLIVLLFLSFSYHSCAAIAARKSIENPCKHAGVRLFLLWRIVNQYGWWFSFCAFLKGDDKKI